MSTPHPIGPTVVLIPVKSFGEAKRRLSPSLSEEARSVLAQRFANTVVDAAHSLPVAVVCDDEGVARWAQSRGLSVLREEGRGLNAAVHLAVGQLAASGVTRAVIVHSDLPLANDLRWLAAATGIVLVPDHRLDGTNAMSLPLRSDVLDRFEFSYGVGSFRKHLDQALAIGRDLVIATTISHDPDLNHDVDLPEDLDEIMSGVRPMTRIP